jgi:MFS family permease
MRSVIVTIPSALRRAVPEDRNVRLLAAATLVNTVGMGMFLSAGLVFLVRSVGLSPTEAGLGLTLGALTGFGAGPLLGDLADRLGGREVMCACMLVEAAASAGLLLVHDTLSLATVAAVAAVGRSGTASARGAVIGVLAKAHNGARLRTYLRAITNVGLAVGTIGSTVILAIDTRPAYTAMVLTDVSTFLVAAFVLTRLPHLAPTRAPVSDSVEGQEARERKVGRWLALHDRRYLLLALTTSVASLQYYVLVQALPIWVTEHTEAPRWVAGALFLIAAVVVAAIQVPATRRITDPRSAARLLALSGPLFWAAWICMAWASGPSPKVAVALLLVGVLVHSLAEVWQAAGTFELSFALADESSQGQYQGVFNVAHGLVESLAPLVVISLCVTGGKTGWMVLAVIVTSAGFASAAVERWSVGLQPRSRPTPDTTSSPTEH